MIAADLGRAVLIVSIPLAYALDALTFPHMLVVAFLMGTLSVLFHVSYSSLFVALVPRERFVEGASLMHGSRALSYVAGPSIGGAARAGHLGAGRRWSSMPCSYVVSALFLRSRRRRGAADRSAGQRPRRRRRALGVRQPDRAGRPRRDGDDQLLQLHLRRALHPLRDEVARRRAGDARARARRRRGRRRRSASLVTGRVARRIGDRPGVRARLRRSSRRRSCSCRSRRGPTLARPRLPVLRRVRLPASA